MKRSTESTEASYRWRVAAWESRHGRAYRSPFESTDTAALRRLLADPTWRDRQVTAG